MDGVSIGFFEYNGTADVAQTSIYLTREELSKNWRTYQRVECQAPNDHEHVDVLLNTSYGRGIEWKSQACLECMAITGNLMPYDDGFSGHEKVSLSEFLYGPGSPDEEE